MYRSLSIRLILSLVLLVLWQGGFPAYAQDARTDVLRLNVYFQRSRTEVDPAFRDNGTHLQAFRDAIEARLREGCTVDAVLLRGSASPEGNTSGNAALAEARSHALDTWFADTLGLVGSTLFHREAVGEDWEGLARIIKTLDAGEFPWRDKALDLIANTPIWVIENGEVVDSRKNRLRLLEGGKVWRWLDANVFPELRAVGVSVECIVSHPLPARTDTVYVTNIIRDTVYINITPEPSFTAPVRQGPDYSGRRMLFAVRTNALAIPLANLGVEVPLGERWSVGADIYYPWIWRPGHRDGIDTNGTCNELMAADVELRYWFPRKDKQPAQRLLGHSIGLYAAAGQYDFERNWSGHQGEFYNVGLDYLWAIPLFEGRMHLELELGVGYISSTSRPYDCLDRDSGLIYHRKGVTQTTTWFGPTRAQVSLVVPIYVRKGGKR